MNTINCTNISEVTGLFRNNSFKINYTTPKLDIFFELLKIKRIARKSKNELKEYVEKNRKIRSGQPVIKGTRILTKEVLLMAKEFDLIKNKSDYSGITEFILEQYPSIKKEEQISYAILYELSCVNTLKFIRILFD